MVCFEVFNLNRRWLEKCFCSFTFTLFQASEERIGSICSFISVAFHVSNASKNETFVNLAVKSILPWAMGQHFNARLYAQVRFSNVDFIQLAKCCLENRLLFMGKKLFVDSVGETY